MGRHSVKLEVGALVYVMLKSGISSKLQSKWRGPFKVTEVIREGGAYRLKDLLSGKIICRSMDKRIPAVRCDKFFVGDFIRNFEISDEGTQVQVRARTIEDNASSDNSDSDTDEGRNRPQRNRKAPEWLGYSGKGSQGLEDG